jgi:glycine C-acetyltransferase
MLDSVREQLLRELDDIRASGLYKAERVITTPQRPRLAVEGAGGGAEVLNFCANNYLGLADDPRVVEAAKAALERWGFGMASVRFICGTQEVHKELERRLSAFLGVEDTVLYSSCFDANGGLFETLLGEDDVVISDELNHASIIDGIRLCRARRLRYRNRDMADLAAKLDEADGARRVLVATDGVFSMDGYLAPLDDICALAEAHGAMVMVDDSHGVGVLGRRGAGTPELFGVADRVDVVTGTLGKALGGAGGGYCAGRRELVELLRQRSRPYLFSNALAPATVGASLAVLDLLASAGELRARLAELTALFRRRMRELGFEVLAGEHPIVPVMVRDATAALRMAERLLDKGIYVIAFSYPVVPRGTERIRVQLSAAHRAEEVERAAAAFAQVRAEQESRRPARSRPDGPGADGAGR